MYVCIYGVNNYCSSFTVLISFILSIVFANLANDVCVYVCKYFFNTFIYQHVPLLMSNTTCIVLNFTYYDLSCLYTFYNIY